MPVDENTSPSENGGSTGAFPYLICLTKFNKESCAAPRTSPVRDSQYTDAEESKRRARIHEDRSMTTDDAEQYQTFTFSHHNSLSRSFDDTVTNSPITQEKEFRQRFESTEEAYYRHIESNVEILRGAFTTGLNRLCSLDVFMRTYTPPRSQDFEEWFWEWRACDKRRVQLERCLIEAGLPVPKPYEDERDEQQAQLTREHVNEPPTHAEWTDEWKERHGKRSSEGVVAVDFRVESDGPVRDSGCDEECADLDYNYRLKRMRRDPM